VAWRRQACALQALPLKPACAMAGADDPFGFSFVIHRDRPCGLLRPGLSGASISLSLCHDPFFLSFAGSSVLSRLLAAVLGGYLLASALAVFLATVLPRRVPRRCWRACCGVLPLYVLAVIWAFSPVSPGRVWLGLLLPTVVLAAASAWLAGGA
jgi:hypothetical protein